MISDTVLLLGANGQLGQALSTSNPVGSKLVPRSHDELDLLDNDSIRSLIAEIKPATVINCAAYTAVDQAESEPDRAFAINAKAVGLLSECLAKDTHLIHVSTDFVFSEPSDSPYKPADKTSPISVYGKSKLEGEKLVMAGHPDNSTIIRTSWLYSPHGKNFVLTMLRLMRERQELGVVSDQFGSPTSTVTLAEVIWSFCCGNFTRGIYHWSDKGVISWYDFAVEIYRQGLEKGLLDHEVKLRPITTKDYPTPAKRPAYSALDCTDTEVTLGVQSRPWQEPLSNVLDALRKIGQT